MYELAECIEIMGPKWLWVMMSSVLVLEAWLSHGCWEQERLALLHLKPFFFSPLYPSLNWTEEEGSDCCQWKLVECNTTTRRVITLSLNFTNPDNLAGNRYLNASLFLPFEELRRLYLPDNQLSGCVEKEGFGKLSKLRHLELLDLSDNFFNDSTLSSLTQISTLKSLYLAGNYKFRESNRTNAYFKWLSGLSNLETLDLSYNNLKNNILLHLDGLPSLRTLILWNNDLEGSVHNQGNGSKLRLINLEVLDLSSNLLNNRILAYLSRLSNLKSLDLSYNRLKGSLDITEFCALSKLETLDMRYNEVNQFVTSKGNGGQLKLINLKELDLSENLLHNRILADLSGFSNLKSLDISSNRLKGEIDIKEFCSLNNLEILDMSFNEVNRFVTSKENGCLRKLKVLYLVGVSTNSKQSFSLVSLLEPFSSVKTLFLGRNYNFNKTIVTQGLHAFSNVEDLIMNDTPLDINFLQSIDIFPSLKTLVLSNCSLTGALPSQGWCYLKGLEMLDLSRNSLRGAISSCLGNLTTLRYLDISNNEFAGNVASTVLTNLTMLQFLSLSNNQFQVSWSFKSFANHSDLKFFLSNGNELVAEPTDFKTWSPTFQLKFFTLSNCRIDEGMKLELLNFLYYQYDLRYVDISFNNFGGIRFPDWLLENNTRLKALYMSDSSIEGTLSLPSHPHYNLQVLNISSNRIGHQIPTNICSVFPQLRELIMSQNALKSKIPHCFGGMKSLRFLDITNNHLFGQIPEELAMSSSLCFLRLSNNNLSGKMFRAKYRSDLLFGLYLDGNNFDGEMPHFSPISSSYFRALDLSNNHLSGKLPIWLWNYSSLLILALTNNQFEGPIPFELCNLVNLKFLDLSQNHLTGTIPSCFSFQHIKHVHLRRNKLSGSLPHAFHERSSLVTLDLSENNFTGKIPDWTKLSALSVLLLQGNQFHGEFPMHLCKLNSLSILDLSHNNLSGPIPSCLGELTLQPRDDKSNTISDVGGLVIFDEELADIGWKIYDLISNKVGYLSNEFPPSVVNMEADAKEVIVFSTKRASLNYTGKILDMLSAIDLSCNQLTGIIPPELGNLTEIRGLNLSHNNLTGLIPSTFSKLKQIESLDLSYNNLNGGIPPQLIELNSLAIFTVAYNNLSGPLPDMKYQFGTFNESSYEGNPLLCGLPLKKTCNKGDSTETPSASSGEHEEPGFIDMGDFYICFGVSYAMVLLAIAIVLYINPYWRRAWFNFIEKSSSDCYFFVVDNLHRL